MIVKVLYGHKKGTPHYFEDILSENENDFEKVKEQAIQNGYDKFRVAKIDLGIPPDFTKTINI